MAKGKWQQWCEPENLERIVNWAANGCTYAELAHNMDIGERTLYTWLDRYEQIQQAVKDGKRLACQAIENALFRKAVGMVVEDHVEEFRGVLRDGQPSDGTIVKRTTKRQVPPDTAAAIFYLKNRMSEKYSDRRETKVDIATPTIVLGTAIERAAE